MFRHPAGWLCGCTVKVKQWVIQFASAFLIIFCFNVIFTHTNCKLQTRHGGQDGWSCVLSNVWGFTSQCVFFFCFFSCTTGNCRRIHRSINDGKPPWSRGSKAGLNHSSLSLSPTAFCLMYIASNKLDTGINVFFSLTLCNSAMQTFVIQCSPGGGLMNISISHCSKGLPLPWCYPVTCRTTTHLGIGVSSVQILMEYKFLV